MAERCSANSYIWWIVWCDSYRLYEKYIKPIVNLLISFYREVIKGHRDYIKRLINKQFISYI